MTKTGRQLLIPPVSPASQGPLYEQITDGVKRAISEGRLRPGQPLPSFRALASDLLVSLITVKRAYEELERQGVIFRKQGLGTFVAPDGDERNAEGRRKIAEDLLRRAVREAREAGATPAEILQLARKIVHEQRGVVHQ